MDRKSFVILVKKYLNGTSTPDEQHFLKKYDEKFENEPVSELTSKEESELETVLFERINQRIRRNENVRRPRVLRLDQYRVAATIAFLICMGWLSYSNRRSIFEIISPSKQISITAAAGKIKKLTLSDGTMVVLNADSKLTYSDPFHGDTRVVQLTGEAYFDVAHDKKKPFVVNTAKLNVQVLGTKFNVNSYHGSPTVDVAVVSGSVLVKPINGEGKVVLSPRQKASFRVSDSSLTTEEINSMEILGWQSGQLNFKNRELSEVLKILERKYAVTIRVSKEIEKCRIYAKISDDPVNTALGAIANLMNAKLDIQDDQYTLTGSGCN